VAGQWRRSLWLSLPGLALVAIASSCSTETEQVGGDACSLASPLPTLRSADEPMEVISITDRSAFAPVVLSNGERWEAYVYSVILGDGGLYRTTSDDGIRWREPQRVFEQGGYLRAEEDGLRMWYQTQWDGEAPAGPRTKIGHARSTDGVTWNDDGVVFEGSDGAPGPDGGPLDDGEIHDPYVWHDGERYHLYYTGFTYRSISDEGILVASIGHAVSADGESFEFESWAMPATACEGSGRYVSYYLRQPIRPACPGCETNVAAVVAEREDCDRARTAVLLLSENGAQFVEAAELHSAALPGTTIIDGADAWSYGAHYGDESTVELRTVELPLISYSCSPPGAGGSSPGSSSRGAPRGAPRA
jgi:hypothetical protein